jgi:hypothetical protein
MLRGVQNHGLLTEQWTPDLQDRSYREIDLKPTLFPAQSQFPMDPRSYCENVNHELTAWKAKIYDVIRIAFFLLWTKPEGRAMFP